MTKQETIKQAFLFTVYRLERDKIARTHSYKTYTEATEKYYSLSAAVIVAEVSTLNIRRDRLDNKNFLIDSKGLKNQFDKYLKDGTLSFANN